MNTENNKVLKQEECSSVCKASTVLGVEMTVEYLKKAGDVVDGELIHTDEIFRGCLERIGLDYADKSWAKEVLGFYPGINHEVRIYLDEKETYLAKTKVNGKEETVLRVVFRADVYERKNVDSTINISQLPLK